MTPDNNFSGNISYLVVRKWKKKKNTSPDISNIHSSIHSFIFKTLLNIYYDYSNSVNKLEILSIKCLCPKEV